MVEVNLSGEQEIRRAQQRLENLTGMRRAFTQAVNRAAQKARTFASRRIRENLNLKAKRVNRDLRVQKAGRGRTTAWIRISRRAVGLVNFGAKQTRKGVTFKKERGGQRQTLSRAWIMQAPGSGKQHVFRRKKGAARYPIDVEHGPSPYQAWQQYAREETYEKAQEELRTELRRQIRRRIEGSGRGGRNGGAGGGSGRGRRN